MYQGHKGSGISISTLQSHHILQVGKKSFIKVVLCANSCEKIYGSICVSISEVKGGATQTLGARRRITNEKDSL